MSPDPLEGTSLAEARCDLRHGTQKEGCQDRHFQQGFGEHCVRANRPSVNLPLEYADLIEVFSKRKASQLPAHHSVDCAIDLLPGTTPTKGRIFPLSQPESESMKTYIQEELAKGFIRPSTSPASAGFFFVKKKDGGLRPCIDYRGLNENTVKFRYPLPLVPAALEQLRQANYYTKLGFT